MAVFGCDYSFSRPNLADLRREGVRFICRYVSAPGNQKNLTAGEVVAAKAVGLDGVVVFESVSGRALAGADAGTEDAKAAAAQVAGLGLAGQPVYFAVDFDAQPKDLPAIERYFQAANTVLGKSRVGVYGGYRAVKYLFDLGIVRYGWQTYAWSNGKWDPRAHIRQIRNGVTLAGATVDMDEAVKPDYGQWVASAPKPSPAVRRRRLRAWVLAHHHQGWTWRRLKNTVQWRMWRRLGGR